MTKPTTTSTPLRVPLLTEQTQVRSNLGTILVVVGFIISVTTAAAVWCTSVNQDLQLLKRDIADIKAALHEHHLASYP